MDLKIEDTFAAIKHVDRNQQDRPVSQVAQVDHAQYKRSSVQPKSSSSSSDAMRNWLKDQENSFVDSLEVDLIYALRGLINFFNLLTLFIGLQGKKKSERDRWEK